MLRVAGAIFLIALYIYFIIDVLRTPSSQTRALPRWAWFLIVLLVPIIGGVLWMIFGRMWPEAGTRFGRRRPAAPDDDPRFLKQIGDDAWAERMRRRRDQDESGGQETPA